MVEPPELEVLGEPEPRPGLGRTTKSGECFRRHGRSKGLVSCGDRVPLSPDRGKHTLVLAGAVQRDQVDLVVDSFDIHATSRASSKDGFSSTGHSRDTSER
jgi:hypothetical protein